MARLVVEMLGDRQLDRRLVRFGRAVGDMSGPLGDLADAVLAANAEQFDTEGRGGWAPLSPAYARRKRAKYGDRPILVASGRLRASLTTSPDVRRVDRDSMEVGSTVPYGVFHQRGTKRMPARPPVALPESFRRDAVRIFQRHLVESLRDAGLPEAA